MATLPVPNPIVNNIVVTYQYQVSPTAPLTTAANISNNVSIQVNVADFVSSKTVDNLYANLGTTLTYTVTLANTGNVTGQSVVFIDTIPTGTTFIPNSLSINGTSTVTSPAPPGVAIPNLSPNAISTVTWQVSVSSIPTTNRVTNSAVTNYTFTVNPLSSPQSAGINSNAVVTTISQAVIDNANGGGMIKTGSIRYAAVNDTITYTIALKNTGNATATSVVLTDTVPTNTTFVPDSVYVNNAQQIGVFPAPAGVTVGSIGPGATSTVTFQVVVNTIPTTNPIINNSTVNYQYTVNPASSPVSGSGNSNAYTTTVSQAYIRTNDGGLVKTISKSYATLGDTITYSIILKNTGNTTANNVMVYDTIPSGTTFVPNSFAINGASQLGANPQSGVNIGSLIPNVITTLTFNVTVASIPLINPTNNTANLTYSYVVDPSLVQRTMSNSSNTVPLTVNSVVINTGASGFTKSVDKLYAGTGDTLTYTIIVSNTGNATANNVVLFDTIPAGTTFVANSVAINSVPQPGASPQAGIPVTTLSPNVPVVITFSVKTI